LTGIAHALKPREVKKLAVVPQRAGEIVAHLVEKNTTHAVDLQKIGQCKGSSRKKGDRVYWGINCTAGGGDD